MLKTRLLPHIYFSYFFLILGAVFGLVYALQLIGIGQDLIRADIARSLHLTLMLYGFIPLMLSLLPFALFDKEGLMRKKGIDHLERFFMLWYIFLVFTILSLLSAVTRSLPFYDFPYELNGLLAFAGLFYLLAILDTIKGYDVKPRWVNVSLAAVIISPFALLLLMNPDYGQVEQMHMGPHGDNTLGMSFALLAIYYLAIKLASPHVSFVTRWHILWQIPLVFYILSVLYRAFIGSLSYESEWFLQYLTLLYIPILYRWWKDAGLSVSVNITLFISIFAFLFVDVQGNILFVPELRALFHRNDLVVGHSHVAVGIGLLFLALAIIEPFIKSSRRRIFFLTSMLVLMTLVLSINGFSQAGFAKVDTVTIWQWRTVFGALFLFGLLFSSKFLNFSKSISVFKGLTPLRLYHLFAFISDGLGGLILLFFASTLYGLIGQEFVGGYQQIVFGFVTGIGLIHLMGFLLHSYAQPLAMATVIVRTLTAGGFFALYKADILGWSALAIAIIDLVFVLVYLLYLQKESHETLTSN
ncbi:hypothetical protein [Sulfurovum sp.]|uniref:hypothetical protein n=1 Tax=Sulfurovum sp. TaxID=1969726 RepID=UPI0035626D83